MKKVFLFIFFSVVHFSLLAQNIFRTACQGNLARLDSLLAHTSINEQDYRERALIHWAVACNQKEVFDYLVKKGIDINVEDDQKKTPMHMAIRFNRETYFNELVQLQPNKDWMAVYGASLLEVAVLKQHKTFIEQLHKHGVDINSTNNRGSTALEIAQRIHANDLADWLLSLGADQNLVRTIEMKGKYMGQTPPGSLPEVYAPNFISTEEYERFREQGLEQQLNDAVTYFGIDMARDLL
ncbi:MAG: ankyrin repeat domain-containing protein, partial [Bacteroidota bacterium]